MGRNKEIISVKAMQKIIESAGAPRVSKKAAEALAEYITKKADEISKHAIKLSIHAGRNTVLSDDIELAARK